MEMHVDIKFTDLTKEATEQVLEAARLAMRDTVVEVENEAAHNSPKATGHNMRSLAGEVSGMGTVVQGGDAEPDRVVDDTKIEGAVYSTSGYGGYLETGTRKMAERPYIQPSAMRHFTEEEYGGHMKEHLGEK